MTCCPPNSPYTIPSVSNFKQQFVRDFPYAVTAYGAAATGTLSGNTLGSVTVIGGGAGYRVAPTVVFTNQPGDTTGAGAAGTAVVGNGTVISVTVTAPGANYILPPLISFVGGAGDDTNQKFVTDEDIAGAILDAQFNINPGLFENNTYFQRAFLYLAAHQLVEKLLMAVEGLASQYNWLTNSKGVGSVNESFTIPEYIKDNPFLANLSKTRYGAMYVQIIWPLLIGNVHSAPRFTLP